jgi:alcohol dehydrogenase class IV
MTSGQRTTCNFHSAGRLVFGSGAIRQLPAGLERITSNKVLIITDRRLVSAGLVDRVRTPLIESGRTVDVFDGGEPEPSLQVAQSALEHAKRFQPDAILGLGGGSNMDLAKITANVLTHGGKFADYFGFDKIPGPLCPLVCVPTTAGTGSEVSHAAVLTDAENQMKVSTLSQLLRPTLAVVDPELTLTCPPTATADSGIDALTHAIEAYTAVDYTDLAVAAGEAWPYDGKTPLGDCLAEKAISLIGEHLVTAVKQPENLPAREGMALAATLAGLAFSNCAVAVVHALEYPLGGALHCSHGAGNGLLLPYVMRFNMPARMKELAAIARLLGEDVTGMEPEAAANQGIAAVEKLRREIGIPERIRELGGSREQLPGFAARAHEIKRLMLLNPRLPSEQDLLTILESAY